MKKEKMSKAMRQCWGLERKSFPYGYKKWFALLLVVAAIIPIAVYLCFAGKGFIYPGVGLEKGQWLSFFSSYIPALATAFLGLTTATLTHYFAQREDSQRMRSIQPVFSVEITNVDNKSEGVYKTAQKGSIHFKGACNTYIAIENIGEKPITDVRVMSGRLPFLLPGKTINICCKYGEGIPEQIECDVVKTFDYDKHKENADFAPREFDIYYVDIDGSSMHQKFALRHQSNEPAYRGYYGLRRVERISFGPEIRDYDVYAALRERSGEADTL